MVEGATESGRVEDARRVLSEAIEQLAAVRDDASAPERAARAALPALADYCMLDFLHGAARVAWMVAHVDPAKEALLRETWRRYPPDPPLATALLVVLRTGRTWISPDIDEATLVTSATDPEHARRLRELGPKSYLCVPLVARGQTLGALSLVSVKPHRRYSRADLPWAEDLARVCASALDRSHAQSNLSQRLARWSALGRWARDTAAEADPGRLLMELVTTAVALVGARYATVFRWDGQRELLVPIRQTDSDETAYISLQAGHGTAGRASTRRAPVIVNHDRRVGGEWTPEAEVHAAVAVPLRHEGRWLGALSVATDDPERQFTTEDAELLEALADLGTAELVGLERAGLRGIHLASRELTDVVNNHLAVASGTLELVQQRGGLDSNLQELVGESVARLTAVARRIQQLQQLARLETKDTPSGPALDFERSISADVRDRGRP